MNPIKMRFQSHAGSIETASPMRRADAGSGFNPTLVRLKPGLDRTGSGRGLSRFNPTLVRLKPGCCPAGSRRSTSFQSHAGSSETRVGPTFPSRNRGFNPMLVRLKPGGEKCFTCRRSVSIPRWFD